MLYTHEIPVANHRLWGRSLSAVVVLPTKVSQIKSFCANAVLQPTTKLLRSLSIVGFDANEHDVLVPIYEVGDIVSPQIGTFSLSLNNTEILTAGSPILVSDQMQRNSFNQNKIEIEPQKVNSGSQLRIVVEETQQSPFATEEYVRQITQDNDLLLEKLTSIYGKIATLTNGYTIKIYIEYD